MGIANIQIFAASDPFEMFFTEVFRRNEITSKPTQSANFSWSGSVILIVPAVQYGLQPALLWKIRNPGNVVRMCFLVFQITEQTNE